MKHTLKSLSVVYRKLQEDNDDDLQEPDMPAPHLIRPTITTNGAHSVIYRVNTDSKNYGMPPRSPPRVSPTNCVRPATVQPALFAKEAVTMRASPPARDKSASDDDIWSFVDAEAHEVCPYSMCLCVCMHPCFLQFSL